MTRPPRIHALKAIAHHCGPETCPHLAELSPVVPDAMKWRIANVRTTAHQMRQALAAALVLLTNGDGGVCPNCKDDLPSHNERCILARLMNATADPYGVSDGSEGP